MRKWITIAEGLGAEEGLSRSRDVLSAIFMARSDGDDITRSEFNELYRDLRANLKFPLTIYRALTFKSAGLPGRADSSISFFDAHQDDLEDYDCDPTELEALKAAISGIDWNNIGVSWTFDRECALAGGALGGGAGNHDGAHVIVEATIKASQCDLLTTLYQNLTVFEEEREVRLYPNIPLIIRNVTPNLNFKLPLRANTGPEKYDTRQQIVDDLLRIQRSTSMT